MFSIDWRKWWVGIFSNKKIPAIFADGGDHNNNNLTPMNCNFYPSIDRGKSGVGIFSNKKSPLSSQTAGRIMYNKFTLMK